MTDTRPLVHAKANGSGTRTETRSNGRRPTRPALDTVLLVHNYYQQPGGEDEVFASEASLLRAAGHRVLCFERHNKAVADLGSGRLATDTLWNRKTAAEIERLVRQERVGVVHFHNTFPLISPSAYWAAHRAGAAVVQTLHNYRLICPGSLLMREGRPCEDCVGRAIPWPGVLHSCYRDSRGASIGSASMIALHRGLGTWSRQVDRYVALTEFSRTRFVAGGLPADRVAVKPNFVWPDPGSGSGDGQHLLFVGRLSEEKGIEVLLDAAAQLDPGFELRIAGDGPLAPLVAERASRMPNVRWLGHVDAAQVQCHMGRARALIVPSLWYENFPRVIVESLALGTPVVASRLGALEEIVRPDRTGALFAVGDAGALASTLGRLLSSPAELAALRQSARAEFERLYSSEANYRQLLAIYGEAIELRSRSTHGTD